MYVINEINMYMQINMLMDQDVYALKEKIGKIKDIRIDSSDWKVTHFEIELEQNIAKSVLGVKKDGVHNFFEGGVRNMLAVSALEKGVPSWTDKGLELKISKDQLHIYLRPVD